jgi:hypothetical protein
VLARRLLLTLATTLALGAAFLLLVKWSDLEAEYINLGTLVGRDDPGPKVDLLWAGIALALLSCALAVLAVRLGRRRL